MDEAPDDGADFVGHVGQEATAQARGLLPKAILHPADTGGTGERYFRGLSKAFSCKDTGMWL